MTIQSLSILVFRQLTLKAAKHHYAGCLSSKHEHGQQRIFFAVYRNLLHGNFISRAKLDQFASAMNNLLSLVDIHVMERLKLHNLIISIIAALHFDLKKLADSLA